MLIASPRLPLTPLAVQHAMPNARRQLRVNPQGDSFENANTLNYFGSYQTHAPRRSSRTSQHDGGHVIATISQLPAFGSQIEHTSAETQLEPYTSGSLPLTTRVSEASHSDVHFEFLASPPPVSIRLGASLAELAECPVYASDQDIDPPSELALAKAKRLLEEVSAYVIDRPDVYPMEDRSVAIDFRNPESKSGVLFLIEQDGSGALFHRTKNTKGRLRVSDAADLLKEGGIMELKRTGIR